MSKLKLSVKGNVPLPTDGDGRLPRITDVFWMYLMLETLPSVFLASNKLGTIIFARA